MSSAEDWETTKISSTISSGYSSSSSRWTYNGRWSETRLSITRSTGNRAITTARMIVSLKTSRCLQMTSSSCFSQLTLDRCSTMRHQLWATHRGTTTTIRVSFCTKFSEEIPSWSDQCSRPITSRTRSLTSGTFFGRVAAASHTCMKDSMNTRRSTTFPRRRKSLAKTNWPSTLTRCSIALVKQPLISSLTLMLSLMNSATSIDTFKSSSNRTQNATCGLSNQRIYPEVEAFTSLMTSLKSM